MELNEKLLKFAGFWYEDIPACSCHPENKRRLWYREDHIFVLDVPDFPSDLNACFKWLVPKLLPEVIKIVPMTKLDTVTGYGCIITPHYWDDDVSVIEETPALALCKAIEQLIDKEQR